MHTKCLSNSELSAFCGQLALVLNAGLSPAMPAYMVVEPFDAFPKEFRLLFLI